MKLHSQSEDVSHTGTLVASRRACQCKDLAGVRFGRLYGRTAGVDTLNGGSDAETIFGLGGSDTIQASAAATS